MFEVLLTPALGLKQSVDYPIALRYSADRGILPTDSARLHLRYGLDDALPLDQLSTANGRLTLTVLDDGGARLNIMFSGEASEAYPVRRLDQTSRYRKLKATEAPALADAGAYMVLPVYGTLIITSAGGLDRQGTTLDFTLLFEASFTREQT